MALNVGVVGPLSKWPKLNGLWKNAIGQQDQETEAQVQPAVLRNIASSCAGFLILIGFDFQGICIHIHIYIIYDSLKSTPRSEKTIFFL